MIFNDLLSTEFHGESRDIEFIDYVFGVYGNIA